MLWGNNADSKAERSVDRERTMRVGSSKDMHHLKWAGRPNRCTSQHFSGLFGCSYLWTWFVPICVSCKVVNCSVFQTSKSLAQVSTHSKSLGLLRQSLLCNCQEWQQFNVVIWKSHAFRKLWEQLKWENIFLLNWFTWETKSSEITEKLGTEVLLGGKIREFFLFNEDQRGLKLISCL